MAPKRSSDGSAKSDSSAIPDNLPALLPPHWKDDIEKWIAQDMPKWDVGGFVVGDAPHHAMLLGKGEGVLAGVPFATYVFEYVGCKIEWLKPEGHIITAAEAAAKSPVAKVTGPTNKILTGERTALNILSRERRRDRVARRDGPRARTAGTARSRARARRRPALASSRSMPCSSARTRTGWTSRTW